MHWSCLYGCNTNTKCLVFWPAMYAASMAPADARVSESITKNKTRAFSFARCSSSIKSGVQSDTCWKFNKKKCYSLSIENLFFMADLPDYKTKCHISAALALPHRLSMLSDCTIRPKILLVHCCHRLASVHLCFVRWPPRSIERLMWLILIRSPYLVCGKCNHDTMTSIVAMIESEIASSRQPTHKIHRTSIHSCDD